MSIKKRLEEDLKRVAADLGYSAGDIVVSIPQNPAFGDYTTNIALQLAKQKSSKDEQLPLEIAKEILSHLGDLSYLSNLEVKGPGFINFFIKPEVLGNLVGEILERGDSFGQNGMGKGQKIQVEFISANPTGPLTLANGRGGAIGSTLANVLACSGYKVETEYYLNDTGNQVRLLGESVLAAAGKFPDKENHYKGGYIKELAHRFVKGLAFHRHDQDPLMLGHAVADYLLDKEIKPAIARLGVKFDEFYSERSIYERGLIAKTIAQLKEKGLAYEKDGALWFKATEFGDEKDRVLLTSEKERGQAEPTYFLADVAHHLDVLGRGYVRRINILGADHHGYAKRMQGVLEALGLKGRLEIIFIQFVRLFKEGQEVRMSKRAGTYVTLDELVDEAGKDAARFFFLMYAPDSHIDFNLDLAKERSNKNPVYYVQYAHARMSNILAKSEIRNPKSEKEEVDYGLLKTKEELGLIKHLAAFPDLVEEITGDYQVQRLTVYAAVLADLLHKFYETSRVLQAETEELKSARLALVKATKIVLANTLGLMGIEAPERM